LEHGNSEPARDKPNVSRNQNVMYVLPHDSAAIAEFMGPVLEQPDAAEASDAPGPRVVVVTPDAESAVAIARFVAALPAGDTASSRVIAATSARRSARLLGARSASVLVGPADQLLDLVRRAAIKLENVRELVIAWADLLIDAGALSSLEALMNEVPKDAARTVVAARGTPEVESLIERYARRPRRVGAVPDAPVASLALRYVVTGSGIRSIALRNLLDALDPPSAAVYVRSDDSSREASDALRTLGYATDDIVRVVRDGATPASLMVLYDLPSSRAELEQLAAAAPNQIVAIVQPRQLPALVSLAGSGGLVPFSLDTAMSAARSSEQRARDELRAVLERGLPVRELLAIEPLLDDFDAASVAAAALALLGAARARPVPNAATGAAAPAAQAAAEPTDARASRPGAPARMFVNVGERDGVSARDLVGAIANEAGIAGSRIGRVEIRENHSIVELDAADAAQAVEKLTGVNIRGRRVNARLDRDRGGPPRERSGPPRDRSGPPRERSGPPRDRVGSRDRAPRDRAPSDRGPRERDSRERGSFDRSRSRDAGPRGRSAGPARPAGRRPPARDRGPSRPRDA